MINIKNCPGTLSPGYDTYSPAALKKLFDGKKVSPYLDFSNREGRQKIIDENIGKISISGVQEKLSAIIENGKIILTPEGIQGLYIIKPAPDYRKLNYRQQMPANEHLTMQIARQVYGITVAENGMVFFRNGESAYLTKRFDIRPNGTKIQQEDFASLSGKTSEISGENYKYTGDYVIAGKLIQQFTAAWQVEISKFYRLILFNYLFSNGDAHLKNFSLQKSDNGDYLLSPAYDLLNTSLHIKDEDFALSDGLFDKQYYSEMYLQKGHPTLDDFATFGQLIGVPNKIQDKILNEFIKPQSLVYELTERSFLNKKLQRMYIRGYEEKLNRLIKKESKKNKKLNSPRIIFMGTPDFAVESLRALVEGGYNVVGVITMPDKPVGKHQSVLQASPVKEYALSRNLPLLQPEKLKDSDFIEQLTTWKADLQIVVAFRMLPEIVWNMPSLGTFNLHASLLPQYRGAAPINWAIINGEKETGVTTFFLTHEIDTGKIIFQERIPIKDTDNAEIIHDQLMKIGAKLVLKTVDAIINQEVHPIEQNAITVNEETLKPAPKIFKETCLIDWQKTTKEIYDFIRGLSPYPTAWTELKTPQGEILNLKIFETEKVLKQHNLTAGSIVTDGKKQLDVATSDGFIRIKNLQQAGKKRMPVEDFLRGNARLFV